MLIIQILILLFLVVGVSAESIFSGQSITLYMRGILNSAAVPGDSSQNEIVTVHYMTTDIGASWVQSNTYVLTDADYTQVSLIAPEGKRFAKVKYVLSNLGPVTINGGVYPRGVFVNDNRIIIDGTISPPHFGGILKYTYPSSMSSTASNEFDIQWGKLNHNGDYVIDFAALADYMLPPTLNLGETDTKNCANPAFKLVCFRLKSPVTASQYESSKVNIHLISSTGNVYTFYYLYKLAFGETLFALDSSKLFSDSVKAIKVDFLNEFHSNRNLVSREVQFLSYQVQVNGVLFPVSELDISRSSYIAYTEYNLNSKRDGNWHWTGNYTVLLNPNGCYDYRTPSPFTDQICLWAKGESFDYHSEFTIKHKSTTNSMYSESVRYSISAVPESIPVALTTGLFTDLMFMLGDDGYLVTVDPAPLNGRKYTIGGDFDVDGREIYIYSDLEFKFEVPVATTELPTTTTESSTAPATTGESTTTISDETTEDSTTTAEGSTTTISEEATTTELTTTTTIDSFIATTLLATTPAESATTTYIATESSVTPLATTTTFESPAPTTTIESSTITLLTSTESSTTTLLTTPKRRCKNNVYLEYNLSS